MFRDLEGSTVDWPSMNVNRGALSSRGLLLVSGTSMQCSKVGPGWLDFPLFVFKNSEVFIFTVKSPDY